MPSSHPSGAELARASLRAIAAFAARNATRIYPILQHHYGEHSGAILTLICAIRATAEAKPSTSRGGGEPASREIPRQDLEGHQCTFRRRLHRVRRLLRGQLPRSRPGRGRDMGGQERRSGRGVRPLSTFGWLRRSNPERSRRYAGTSTRRRPSPRRMPTRWAGPSTSRKRALSGPSGFPGLTDGSSRLDVPRGSKPGAGRRASGRRRSVCRGGGTPGPGPLPGGRRATSTRWWCSRRRRNVSPPGCAHRPGKLLEQLGVPPVANLARHVLPRLDPGTPPVPGPR